MDDKEIIQKTCDFIKNKFSGESTGHDWYHVERVRRNAVRIGESEHADMFIVEIAALLHDIADYKFHGGDEDAGPRAARQWLESLGVEESVISNVCDIVKNISFKGAGVGSKMRTIEGMVVQDADRLDAIGAVGIARCFAYGGHKGHEIYNPELKPRMHDSFEEYKNSRSPSINHFHEKLLLLKDLMNTDTAKRIAEERHEFMEQFLEEFYREWEGKG